MKRKNMMGLIAVAVIVSVAIFPIHAEIEEANTSDHLQDISIKIKIKINVTASSWRGEPYDIYNATKEKLERVGFKVVPKESTVYDAILFINYEEREGPPYGYSPVLVDIPVGYGTIITCSLRLEDREYGLLFNEHITASTPMTVYLPSDSNFTYELYREALFDFRFKFKYLGILIAKRYSEIGDERVVEQLIQALKDENRYVREEAAMALGEIGDKRAVEPLINALKDEDSDVRMEAAEALDQMGWKPGYVTEKAYYLVAKKEWDEAVKLGEPAVEPLINALKDKEAAEALVKIGDERAVEPLINALKDEDSSVRWEAAGALGEIGDERAVEPLINALKDEASGVRWEAAEALGEIGDERAVEPLINALKDEDSDVRWKAAEALVKIGEPAVEPLIHALKDEDSDVRAAAAMALGKIGDERAVVPLTEALEDESYQVREAAKKALADIQKQKIPGFELIFAIAGLLAVAYILRRKG